MKKKLHGNSNRNKASNHLYEIRDKQDGGVFKYGISQEPIGPDRLSKRVRTQIRILNLGAGWARYFGRILLRGIKGRSAAKKAEMDYIENHIKKHGHKPRGN